MVLVPVKNLQAPVAVIAVETVHGQRIVSISYDKVMYSPSLPIMGLTLIGWSGSGRRVGRG
jgi:hypothetical protein